MQRLGESEQSRTSLVRCARSCNAFLCAHQLLSSSVVHRGALAIHCLQPQQPALPAAAWEGLNYTPFQVSMGSRTVSRTALQACYLCGLQSRLFQETWPFPN